MKIQVIACDVDRQVPALTYTITASDGRTVKADLCEMHAESIEDLLTNFGQAEETEPEAEPEKRVRPEFREAVPTQQKPAPAKKTTARRRPKITSLAEIEAKKQV
ncbi:hypothetical protein ACWD6R_24105 [Streptomyces sp. NPDC005151]